MQKGFIHPKTPSRDDMHVSNPVFQVNLMMSFPSRHITEKRS